MYRCIDSVLTALHGLKVVLQQVSVREFGASQQPHQFQEAQYTNNFDAAQVFQPICTG